MVANLDSPAAVDLNVDPLGSAALAIAVAIAHKGYQLDPEELAAYAFETAKELQKLVAKERGG